MFLQALRPARLPIGTAQLAAVLVDAVSFVTKLAQDTGFAAHARNKKLGPKSYADARQCLELPTNEAIIRCAERYM